MAAGAELKPGDGPVVVLGLGVAGRAAARALRLRGYDVVAFEDRPSQDTASFADDIGAELIEAPTNEDLADAFATASAFLPSPGIPEHHGAFVEAQRVGLPIISEFDLARWWDDRPIIAVTGTDGKTSVTLLTVEMLEASGIRAAGVGNTDTPLVKAIDDPTYDVFVVEASSFRLGHSSVFTPVAAAWLNFSPDHLDVHADLARYETAKAKIWEALPIDGLAVAPIGDFVVRRHLPKDREVVLVSSSLIEASNEDLPPEAHLAHVVDGDLILDGRRLAAVSDLSRSYPHDISNALTAAALASRAGASDEAIAKALSAFSLPPHRIQSVATIDDVEYVNDSKATVPHAVVTAVNSFASVVLIAGGKNKGLDLSEMGECADKLRAVIAVGDAADEVDAVFVGAVPTHRATDMEDAVGRARLVAERGDVVLLSPGCTSFDAYGSYAERGDHFIQLVSRLAPSGAASGPGVEENS